MLPNDLNQSLRKLDNVRKNNLSLKFGMSSTTQEDEPYQTDVGFDARKGFVFLQARCDEYRRRKSIMFESSQKALAA